jgi:hypothetical protein
VLEGGLKWFPCGCPSLCAPPYGEICAQARIRNGVYWAVDHEVSETCHLTWSVWNNLQRKVYDQWSVWQTQSDDSPEVPPTKLSSRDFNTLCLNFWHWVQQLLHCEATWACSAPKQMSVLIWGWETLLTLLTRVEWHSEYSTESVCKEWMSHNWIHKRSVFQEKVAIIQKYMLNSFVSRCASVSCFAAACSCLGVSFGCFERIASNTISISSDL